VRHRSPETSLTGLQGRRSRIDHGVQQSAKCRPVAFDGGNPLRYGNVELAQVSANGSYLSDLFPGLLILGLGIGRGPVAAITAAVSSVKEHEAGVASGINTAFFQIGVAPGTAIVSGVIISQAGQSTRPTVLTRGFQAGFTACVAFAIVGLIVVVTLLRHGIARNDTLGRKSMEQLASLPSKTHRTARLAPDAECGGH